MSRFLSCSVGTSTCHSYASRHFGSCEGWRQWRLTSGSRAPCGHSRLFPAMMSAQGPLTWSLGNRVKRVEIRHLSEHAHMLPALAELHLAQWGREGESREARMERIRRVVGHPRSVPSVYIALVGGELSGSVALLERDALRGDQGPWLAGLYVSPGRRGTGIGRELVRWVVAEAILVGAQTLHLACEPELESYYASLGWQRVGSSADLVVMSYWAVA